MKLTKNQIRELVSYPERANSGEKRRLLKILSGEGRACTEEERQAEKFARQFKQSNTVILGVNYPAPNYSTTPKKRRKRKVVINPERERRRQEAKKYKARLPIRDTGPHQPKDYKQYIDEGISGNREDNLRVRGNNSRDSARRNHD